MELDALAAQRSNEHTLIMEDDGLDGFGFNI
jgi:hypothetical protein